jgi:hypothetical protein
MKSPILLVCAMVAAMGMTVMAEEKAAGAAGDKAQVQGEKGKHGEMTEAQREARMTKQLEQIKAKDEAQYKELIALKEKDPEAFKAKMKELRAKDHPQGKGEGQGRQHGKKVETKEEVKK